MYCGDETGAYIGDIGTHTSRFGYGGEDNPKCVIPSYSAKINNKEERYVPSSCYHHHEDLKPIYRTTSGNEPIIDPNEFLQQGDSIINWDSMEEVWKNSMETLRVNDRYKHTKGGNNKVVVEKDSIDDTSSTNHHHPILAVRSGCSYMMDSSGPAAVASARRKELERYTEFLIESLGCEACFIAPSPMLAAFSHGRQTCLVVDVGCSGTRVTPVVDGYVLENSQRRNGRGSDYLYNVVWKSILTQQDQNQERVVTTDNTNTDMNSPNKKMKMTTTATILPRYQLLQNKRNVIHNTNDNNPYLTHWAMKDLMYEFLTSLYSSSSITSVLQPWTLKEEYTVPFLASSSFSSNNTPSAAAASDATTATEIDATPKEEATDETSSEYYTLPDGTKVNLQTKFGRDFKRVPELFFTDELPFLPNNAPIHLESHPSISSSHCSIQNLVKASLTAVGDADLRKELCSNIVLVGGASNSLEQRLSYELARLFLTKTKVLGSKFHAERHHAAWIGASILTSLGSFQQLWLSKKEYEEYGAALAVQRFP
eukprot:CAMPEP_0194195276 /NCGR_PEP_ID=MMETSP0154-20130528/76047_1 /TAXON_ID=1049557 /ORGANISM="Thalassiothrix antarctica, Strain L6-D1" /LENGTH=538 /DNA_ID=CAMNT_0038919791 /DNA_START=41 /DNA_END=1657 /DNA_ORIENTATION=-